MYKKMVLLLTSLFLISSAIAQTKILANYNELQAALERGELVRIVGTNNANCKPEGNGTPALTLSTSWAFPISVYGKTKLPDGREWIGVTNEHFVFLPTETDPYFGFTHIRIFKNNDVMLRVAKLDVTTHKPIASSMYTCTLGVDDKAGIKLYQVGS